MLVVLLSCCRRCGLWWFAVVCGERHTHTCCSGAPCPSPCSPSLCWPPLLLPRMSSGARLWSVARLSLSLFADDHQSLTSLAERLVVRRRKLGSRSCPVPRRSRRDQARMHHRVFLYLCASSLSRVLSGGQCCRHNLVDGACAGYCHRRWRDSALVCGQAYMTPTHPHHPTDATCSLVVL